MEYKYLFIISFYNKFQQAKILNPTQFILMERNASNMKRSEKIKQLLNQQNNRFQSEVVKKISIKEKILEVIIQQKVYSQQIKTNENIFANYFENIHFNTLQQLFLRMDQIILPKINAPLLQRIKAEFVGNLSLSQFAQGNYPSLKMINAFACSISQLPQLSGCSSIQKLYLGDNIIQNIDLFLKGSYPCLRILHLRENQIREIYKIDAKNLEQLDLSGNLIYSIDKLTDRYQKLKIIQLSSNKLISVPFINAPILQELYVSENQILQLDQFYSGNIAKYERLKNFQCGNNLIKQIPRFLTLKNACSLRQLNLESCGIENIQILSQIELNKIRHMHLSENRIVSFKIFHKLRLCQVNQINLFKNLSDRRDFMSRCQINGSQDPLYQQDGEKKIKMDQDTDSGGYNLSWLLKYQKEKVRIDLQLYYKQHLNLKDSLRQAFERKKKITIHDY